MSNCIFCSIVEGRTTAFIIYQDKNLLAIMDRYPSAQGHVLILPKRHVTDIYGLNAKEAAEILPLAQKISAKMKNVLGMSGLNLIQNNGKDAGQVIDHFHLHLVPRYENDGIVISNTKPINTTPEELEHLAGLLYLQ